MEYLGIARDPAAIRWGIAGRLSKDVQAKMPMGRSTNPPHSSFVGLTDLADFPGTVAWKPAEPIRYIAPARMERNDEIQILCCRIHALIMPIPFSRRAAQESASHTGTWRRIENFPSAARFRGDPCPTIQGWIWRVECTDERIHKPARFPYSANSASSPTPQGIQNQRSSETKGPSLSY